MPPLTKADVVDQADSAEAFVRRWVADASVRQTLLSYHVSPEALDEATKRENLDSYDALNIAVKLLALPAVRTRMVEHIQATLSIPEPVAAQVLIDIERHYKAALQRLVN